MTHFHGTRKKRAYFEGWYLKQQSGPYSLALIPAYHIDEYGNPSASIQIITPDGSDFAAFDSDSFTARKERFWVRIGKNVFSEQGMKLDLSTPQYKITGQVRFHSLTPLSYSAMGPFSLLPFMQCSHEVLSLYHTVEGTLLLNDKPLVFHHGIGYIEKDRGTSFPSQYFWTQGNRFAGESQSIFMSAARIPIGGFSFTGTICCILYGGRQYRLATYLGAKVLRLRPQTVIVRQGKKYLRADVLKAAPHPLQAPMRGDMSRSIQESLCCQVRYRFYAGSHLLLDEICENASYEYVAPDKESAT